MHSVFHARAMPREPSCLMKHFQTSRPRRPDNLTRKAVVQPVDCELLSLSECECWLRPRKICKPRERRENVATGASPWIGNSTSLCEPRRDVRATEHSYAPAGLVCSAHPSTGSRPWLRSRAASRLWSLDISGRGFILKQVPRPRGEGAPKGRVRVNPCSEKSVHAGSWTEHGA